ncbi:hypothetical protein OTU49_007557, partial [Cherax quadricarinatus]
GEEHVGCLGPGLCPCLTHTPLHDHPFLPRLTLPMPIHGAQVGGRPTSPEKRPPAAREVVPEPQRGDDPHDNDDEELTVTPESDDDLTPTDLSSATMSSMSSATMSSSSK